VLGDSAAAYYLKGIAPALEPAKLRTMTRFLHNWCAQAMKSGIAQMMSLAKTLRAHDTGPRILPPPLRRVVQH